VSFSYAAAAKDDMNPFPSELSGVLYESLADVGTDGDLVVSISRDGYTLKADENPVGDKWTLLAPGEKIEIRGVMGRHIIVSVGKSAFTLNEPLPSGTIVRLSDIFIVNDISLTCRYGKANYKSLKKVFDMIPSVKEMRDMSESKRSLYKELGSKCT
jgi:hypothetical protein